MFDFWYELPRVLRIVLGLAFIAISTLILLLGDR